MKVHHSMNTTSLRLCSTLMIRKGFCHYNTHTKWHQSIVNYYCAISHVNKTNKFFFYPLIIQYLPLSFSGRNHKILTQTYTSSTILDHISWDNYPGFFFRVSSKYHNSGIYFSVLPVGQISFCYTKIYLDGK